MNLGKCLIDALVTIDNFLYIFLNFCSGANCKPWVANVAQLWFSPTRHEIDTIMGRYLFG